VEFPVGALGRFAVQGRFPRFGGELLLQLDQPERSHIDVAIDAGSVGMPQQDQADLLRSDAYFDTAHHPTERFTSTAPAAQRGRGHPERTRDRLQVVAPQRPSANRGAEETCRLALPKASGDGQRRRG
jgi:hypothetical protein